jgi:DNA-binding XRE family transcriptional regulator
MAQVLGQWLSKRVTVELKKTLKRGVGEAGAFASLRHNVPFRGITPYHIVHVNQKANVARTRTEQRQLKLFGANVRRERVAAAMTQAKLSELVDLNIRNLQKIEAGETNVLLTTVARIRRALGCSSDKLVPCDW